MPVEPLKYFVFHLFRRQLGRRYAKGIPSGGTYDQEIFLFFIN